MKAVSIIGIQEQQVHQQYGRKSYSCLHFEYASSPPPDSNAFLHYFLAD